MLTLSRRTIVTGTALGTIALAVPMAIAGNNGDGGGMPANKAVAAGSKSAIVPPGSATPILSATLKTSKPTDLLMSLSLECSILTDNVITGGAEKASDTARTEATIKVWITIDGKIVPIEDASTPPQDPDAQKAGDDTDKVTFCDRLHERTVTDMEDDGVDGSSDYQRTKAANAFNWVRLNAGSGIHDVKVFATLTSSASPGSTANGFIGNRTLIIEPTKMANDAEISENGSS